VNYLLSLLKNLIILLFLPLSVFAQEFKKYHIWDEFYTEGSTIADVNKDGKLDIIAGARWFENPDGNRTNIWSTKSSTTTRAT